MGRGARLIGALTPYGISVSLLQRLSRAPRRDRCTTNPSAPSVCAETPSVPPRPLHLISPVPYICNGALRSAVFVVTSPSFSPPLHEDPRARPLCTMRLSLRLLALTATFELSSLVTAGPLGVSPRSLTKTLIFDAPGLSTSSGVTAQIRSYVYLKTPLDAVAKVFEAFASSIGSSIGDSLSNLEERIELFATLGLADQSVDVKVSGCSKATVSLGETPGLPNPGMQASTANLGTCSGAALAGVDADNSNVKFTVYPTAATGWGVISGIA